MLNFYYLFCFFQNCCPSLHQRGAFCTTGIFTRLPLVLRHLLTKSRPFTIGHPDYWLTNQEPPFCFQNRNPAIPTNQNQELHATQRTERAVGGQRKKTRQTVVAQLSETQVSFQNLSKNRVSPHCNDFNVLTTFLVTSSSTAKFKIKAEPEMLKKVSSPQKGQKELLEDSGKNTSNCGGTTVRNSSKFFLWGRSFLTTYNLKFRS